MHVRPFLDTNVLVYFAGSGEKADVAEALLDKGAVVSVQVLNELANVCRRKLRYEWARVIEVTVFVRTLAEVVPLTVDAHELGLAIANRYRTSLYDSVLLASAVLAGCDTFFSEDLQDGFSVGSLTVRNPFG